MKTGLQKAAEILLPDVPIRLKVKQVIERLMAEEHPLIYSTHCAKCREYFIKDESNVGFDYDTCPTCQAIKPVGVRQTAARVIPAPVIRVLFEVQKERRRQEEKWGQQNHKMADYYTILGEEFGEVGKAICESKLQGKVQAAQIRAELIQTAAVAVAMVEAFDRQKVQP